MNFAVVPVKYLNRAKRRLADVLSPDQRRRLTLAMLEDVLQALTGSSTLDRVLVTSPDQVVWEVAQGLGVEVLVEEDQLGENSALEVATETCLKAGADSMLAISADVPLITPKDVDSIVGAGSNSPAVVIAPSRDGTGVNALLRRPPDAIPLRFGRESLRRHLGEAKARGVPCHICFLPRVALDIDSPKDLARFASHESPTKTYQELVNMGIVDRVRQCGPGEKGYAPELRVIGITGIPDVKPGDDLVELICTASERQGVEISERDILVVTHKVVSKAEGRLVPLERVIPSGFATAVATQLGRDPKHLEVILGETKRVVRMDRGILITETRHGFICANSGVDRSNVPGDSLALLPVDPDKSARCIQEGIKGRMGKHVAVIITDTFGRPWRRGLTNVAIGVAGLRPLLDYRGWRDAYGHLLRATEMAVADELAAAAELVMGKFSQIPVAIVRGYDYLPGESTARELVRPRTKDLFR